MKKLFVTLMFTSLAALAAKAVSIGDVIVRQQWPWKTQVNVDFLVSGAASSGGLSQVTLAAYRGDRFLGNIPLSACTGDVTFTTDGAKRVSFDPASVDFIAAQGPMSDFSVDVSVTGLPMDTALYMVFDLGKMPGESGQLRYVTEEALTNGLWGAWERDYWGAEIARSVIWTGVTNNPAYKSTHLVMRRIPAGEFPMGESGSSQNIKITKPYYVGVFEFTQAQHAMLADMKTNVLSESGLRLPVGEKRYSAVYRLLSIRGYKDNADYSWPTGTLVWDDSICGVLRSRTGMAFDLPTEAQWEKAARGGSTGLYYASNSNEENSSLASQLAWNRSSERSVHEVGLKKPNAYGLYDVIGNLQEFVLDWYVEDYVHPITSDPPGPDQSSPSSGQRVTKGGNYDGLASNGCYLRSFQNSTTGNAKVGFRVCCPAP